MAPSHQRSWFLPFCGSVMLSMYHLHLAKVAVPAIMLTFQPERRGKMSYKNFPEFVHTVFVYILLIGV